MSNKVTSFYLASSIYLLELENVWFYLNNKLYFKNEGKRGREKQPKIVGGAI